MKTKLFYLCLIGLAACTQSPTPSQTPTPKTNKPTQSQKPNPNHDNLITQALQHSTGKTQAVLAQAHKMTLQQEIVKGGCWDFLDAAWTRAGVNRNDRKVVYTDKINGTYANPNQLRAGDWIYHVNHNYNNIEHSGLFIGWVNQEQKLGLTLSYAGEHRQEPARYKVYDLSSVYQITRAE